MDTTQYMYDASIQEATDEVLETLETQNIPAHIPPNLAGTSLGIYYKEAKEHPLLSHEECVELFKQKEAGDEKAREIIISSNLLLVTKFAHKYSLCCNIAEEDLIQDGNIGLLIAIDKYDYRKGYHFSTYASYWIAQAIRRGISDKSRVIRLPSYVHESIRKILRAEIVFAEENARQPTMAELVKITGFSEEQIIKLKTSYVDVISLSTLVKESDGETEISSFIEDESTLDVQEEYDHRNLKTALCEVISSTLNDRATFIILKRFGLIDGKTYTLDEIGKELGLSRERVRQIQEKGLNRLRRDKKFCKLFKTYVE